MLSREQVIQVALAAAEANDFAIGDRDKVEAGYEKRIRLKGRTRSGWRVSIPTDCPEVDPNVIAAYVFDGDATVYFQTLL